jgi:hypothetical protein
VSSGESSSGQRTESDNLQKTPLMAPDELARHFAREAGNILALIPHPDYPPFALKRCRYFSAEDDALFGGLFDPVGMEKPLTRASERLKRKAFADVVKL